MDGEGGVGERSGAESSASAARAAASGAGLPRRAEEVVKRRAEREGRLGESSPRGGRVAAEIKPLVEPCSRASAQACSASQPRRGGTGQGQGQAAWRRQAPRSIRESCCSPGGRLWGGPGAKNGEQLGKKPLLRPRVAVKFPQFTKNGCTQIQRCGGLRREGQSPAHTPGAKKAPGRSLRSCFSGPQSEMRVPRQILNCIINPGRRIPPIARPDSMQENARLLCLPRLGWPYRDGRRARTCHTTLCRQLQLKFCPQQKQISRLRETPARGRVAKGWPPVRWVGER